MIIEVIPFCPYRVTGGYFIEGYSILGGNPKKSSMRHL